MTINDQRFSAGLTTRPHKVPKGTPLMDNPLSAAYQTWLVLQLCGLLGLQRIVVVGAC